jgi:hypothetical protein
MRGEADLRRLAEIGVDTYEPRAAVAQSGAAAASDGGASPSAIGAVLIGDGSTQRASGLLDAVMRAFAFAKVSCTRADAGDEAVLADARALVAFGEARARAAGAMLSAQRQREISWVVTGELAALATDARAKRALWSELKRIARHLHRGDRTNGG